MQSLNTFNETSNGSMNGKNFGQVANHWASSQAIQSQLPLLDTKSSNIYFNLIDQISQTADQQNIGSQNKQSHIAWVLKFLRFHHKKPAQQLNEKDIESYLSYLAETNSYKNQAAAEQALGFLYIQVFNRPMRPLHFPRLKCRRGFFSRFGKTACQAVIERLDGDHRLMAQVAVLANLKLHQIAALTLADIDLKKAQMIIRTRCGKKSFMAAIPVELVLKIRIQTLKVRRHLAQLEEKGVSSQAIQINLPLNKLPLFLATSNKSEPSALLKAVSLSLFKKDIQLAVSSYLRELTAIQSRVLVRLSGRVRIFQNHNNA